MKGVNLIRRPAIIALLASLIIGGDAYASCGVAQFGTYQQVAPTFNGTANAATFGWSVSSAGDVNLDGVDDLIVGDSSASVNGTNSGQAIVYSGANSSILYVFNGASAKDFYGHSVAGLGDVNGDGYSDVLIGADQFQHANPSVGGYAEVRSGFDGSLIYSHSSLNPDDRMGISVASGGDVNRDGIPDYIVGADQFGTGPGYAQVFSGATGTLMFTLTGSIMNNSNFARSVSSAGDVNRDGRDDIIVGAPFDDITGTDSGRVFIFSGANGAVIHDIPGLAAGDWFGFQVGTIGDLDGDAREDVIISATQATTSVGIQAGEVYVLSGLNASVIQTHSGTAAFQGFGTSLDGLGDINGDGCPDYLVGTQGDNTAGIAAGSVKVFSGSTGGIIY
ncbi:MAG: FG-GAP repeat protein, partial [Bdellovibrionales bacterium]|nr:FG-GAP repeat protein [Bdellovibrionales bacterium]